jgi:hypothetical protein
MSSKLRRRHRMIDNVFYVFEEEHESGTGENYVKSEHTWYGLTKEIDAGDAGSLNTSRVGFDSEEMFEVHSSSNFVTCKISNPNHNDFNRKAHHVNTRVGYISRSRALHSNRMK